MIYTLERSRANGNGQDMDKNCSNCNSITIRLKKGLCNPCYEVQRISSKPLINLTCENCGPVIAKKLTNGMCNKCYRVTKDPTSTKQCLVCSETKTNIFVKGLCQACYSDNHRIENPEIYKKSRIKTKDNIAKNGRYWRDKNPGKQKAKDAKRRATKLKATPIWTDLIVIVKIYENCPLDKSVDHIVPLKGENVSGLHVPWNLQYLTPRENSQKSNKFDGTRENNGWRTQC